MQRRDFFKSFTKPLKKEDDHILRPPYILEESTDFSACVDCDAKCAEVCEEDIIVILQDSSPSLVFDNSGCTYCDECAKVCEADILKLEYKKNINAIISIDELQCLSWSKTMCFACKDPCLDNAIEFSGMFYPKIIDDKCTSCGFCIKYCPTNAIKIKGKR